MISDREQRHKRRPSLHTEEQDLAFYNGLKLRQEGVFSAVEEQDLAYYNGLNWAEVTCYQWLGIPF